MDIFKRFCARGGWWQAIQGFGSVKLDMHSFQGHRLLTWLNFNFVMHK